MAKRKGKTTRSGSPTCSCLLLCEDVIVSHGKDKHTLTGIIGAMAAPRFPAVLGNFVAYVRVSNVHLQQSVVVSFEAPDGSTCWEIEAEFVNANLPLDVYTLVARIPPFQARNPGRYMLKAAHAGVPLAHTPIQVQSLIVPQEPP